ncbi:hypothetical protein G7067_04365 [Leucobacter insecticola]|uniref:Lipoprotein n=1 Tax=Leucobacter insecticola TaxID=2714934 RepID=A0A6G8FHR2_9MICO|nr:hypothetical protein [Leucobacter insecticola]QIM15819.1 hypothetical protein G7067_04365 [Leucobacter insecticola]
MGKLRIAAAGSSVGVALVLALTLSACQGGGVSVEGVPEQVKTVPGEVSNTASADDSNWSFTVTVEDKKTQEEAVTRLTDAGFRELGQSETSSGKTIALTNDKEKVNVTLLLTQQDGKFQVVYNIVKL